MPPNEPSSDSWVIIASVIFNVEKDSNVSALWAVFVYSPIAPFEKPATAVAAERDE